MTTSAYSSRARAQRGAVLITSLLLLLVMTMLAVSSMNTATMEERMATNSALRSRAFQAAESAIPAALPAGWTDITGAICHEPGGTPTEFDVTGLGSAVASTAAVCYLDAGEGQAMAEGYSMGEDNPLGVEPHYFEIHATGEIRSGSETLSSAELTAGVLIPPGG